MTDTAVPLPELPDYTESADDTTFNLDQHRRVEALKVARSILENKPSPFAGTKVEAIRSVGDLTYLADWILAGSSTDTEPTDIVELRNAAGELMIRIPVATKDWPTDGQTVSVSSKPGVWEPLPSAAELLADAAPETVSAPWSGREYAKLPDDADAAADADHRAARSDADDGN